MNPWIVPLPIRVAPHPQEALGGYLRRVAQKLHTPLDTLLQALAPSRRQALGPGGIRGRTTVGVELQTALATYLNLSIEDVQRMLPQYSSWLSEPIPLGSFGTLPLHVHRELEDPSFNKCCPRCRSEAPQIEKLAWLFRSQIICLDHHCRHENRHRPNPQPVEVSDAELLAQAKLNRISLSDTPSREAIVRGVAAYIRLLGSDRTSSRRPRWLTDAIEIMDHPDHLSVAQIDGGRSTFGLAEAPHSRGLFNGRYNNPGGPHVYLVDQIPEVLPASDFAGTLSDLAYPTPHYLGRHFAGLACRGLSPLHITPSYSLDAASTVVPEYLRMCIRLDTEGRWDQWQTAVANERKRQVAKQINYKERRRVVETGTAAELLQPQLLLRHRALLRAWLHEWAGIYQEHRPRPDVYDDFTIEFGPRLQQATLQLDQRAAA